MSRFELDDRGRGYIRELLGWPTLGAELVARVPLDRGVVFSDLPSEVGREGAHELRTGGQVEGAWAPPVPVPGGGSLMPVLPPEDLFLKYLGHYLAPVERRLAVLYNGVYGKKEVDPQIDVRCAVFEQELYELILPADAEQRRRATFRDMWLTPRFVTVLTEHGNLARREPRDGAVALTGGDLTRLAASCRGLLLAAYDGEGLVAWVADEEVLPGP